VLTVQGIFTVFSILISPWLLSFFRLDPLHLSVLRLGIYSSFALAGCLFCMNILLYFDHQKEALRVVATFCFLNGIFTEASLRLGLFAYGYGFGLASLVALFLAIYYLNSRLSLLHFWTFTRQPFPEPVIVTEEQIREQEMV